MTCDGCGADTMVRKTRFPDGALLALCPDCTRGAMTMWRDFAREQPTQADLLIDRARDKRVIAGP